MSVVFPNFGLIGEIDPCSENAIDLINENFKKLDFILAFGVTRVSSLSLTASDGDKELLSTNNVIYYWESGQWNPVDLNIGIVAWDITNENAIMWNGTEWFVLNENTTAVNLGTGFEVFKEKISDELNFRTIIAGDNITITETADSLEIESAGGGSGSDSITEVSADYTVGVNDINLLVDATADREIIMPDPSVVEGRIIKLYVSRWQNNSKITLRDSTDTENLFIISEGDLKESTNQFTTSSIKKSAHFFEYISFKTNTENFWAFTSASNNNKAVILPSISSATISGANPSVALGTLNIGHPKFYENISLSGTLVFSTNSQTGRYVIRVTCERTTGTGGSVISSLDLDRTADNVGPEFFNFNFNLAGDLFQDFQEYEAIISIFRASGAFSTMILGTANSSAFDGRINISREL